MKIFETVAALKLATLSAGQVVKTKGYISAGDGFGAEYLVTAPQTVDDKVNFLVVNGSAVIDTQNDTNLVTTTIALEDITATVNTLRKFTGIKVFNSTTGKLVCSAGDLVGSLWVNSGTGATEHTPI